MEGRLPDHLEFIQDIDVDLGLVPPGEPGFARRPDLIIALCAAGELGYQDAPAMPGEFAAAEPFPVKLEPDRLLA